MEVIELVEQMQDICTTLRRSGRRIAFVPTMGALHEGHTRLIACASAATPNQHQHQLHPHPHPQLDSQASANNAPDTQQHPVVIVSIFVNPKQFDSAVDLANYPNTLQTDLNICRQLGVKYVFAPSASQMYPTELGCMCEVSPPPQLSQQLEGNSRPGHFAGVLTVVAKLFNIVQPNEAFFGLKDYQQLALVRKMVKDLNMDTRVRGVETVRDPDGLPLSSRNVRLAGQLRQTAPLMVRILEDAKEALETSKAHSVDTSTILLGSMLTSLALRCPEEQNGDSFQVDYLEVRCAQHLQHIHHDSDINCFTCPEGCGRDQLESSAGEEVAEPARLEGRILIAAMVGGVRLLDNMCVVLNSNGPQAFQWKC